MGWAWSIKSADKGIKQTNKNCNFRNNHLFLSTAVTTFFQKYQNEVQYKGSTNNYFLGMEWFVKLIQ